MPFDDQICSKFSSMNSILLSDIQSNELICRQVVHTNALVYVSSTESTLSEHMTLFIYHKAIGVSVSKSGTLNSKM